MVKSAKLAKNFAFVVCLALMTVFNSGCQLTAPLFPASLLLFEDFNGLAFNYAGFWKTTPLLPVSAYYSQLIEDTYHEEERYGKVPILDPVEGEHAPIFCVDPPSPDEVMRALPVKGSGGAFFLAETSLDNVRIVFEPIVDRLGECRFYPMVGFAKLHHCHYRCTVYFDKTIRSDWPIPFTHTDQSQEVVYIDHDHLIRCAGPATPQ